MRLPRALARLPQSFDPAKLSAELAQFSDKEWSPLPGGSMGSATLPLVTVGGTANHDFALAGPAKVTPALSQSPALQGVLRALGVPISRSRLIRQKGGEDPPIGVDWNYHWYRRSPILIPIVAGPGATLECGGEVASMNAGEGWIFDSSREHRLRNLSTQSSVHLLVETRAVDIVAPRPGGSILLEPYRFEVLTPDEIEALAQEIRAELRAGGSSDEDLLTLDERLLSISQRWKAAFSRFGHHNAGELAYQDLILDFREQILRRLAAKKAGMRAATVIDTMLWMSPPSPRKFRLPPSSMKGSDAPRVSSPAFDRPVFVVAAPRSGSTLLFDLLARFPEAWTIGGESHEVIRGIAELHPERRSYESDRLTAADASPSIIAELRDQFARRLVDRDGRSYVGLSDDERPRRLRFVEKTPANALRIPFLRAAFPDALFVYLHRDARENISSLVEGWRSRRFLAYRGMPGWPHRDWSFLLPPGWSSLEGRPIVEIAAFQWKITNSIIEDDLRALPSASWCKVSYEDLVRSPKQALEAIAELAALRWDPAVEEAVIGTLPLTRVTLSAPSPEKWRRHEAELDALSAFLGQP